MLLQEAIQERVLVRGDDPLHPRLARCRLSLVFRARGVDVPPPLRKREGAFRAAPGAARAAHGAGGEGVGGGRQCRGEAGGKAARDGAAGARGGRVRRRGDCRVSCE